MSSRSFVALVFMLFLFNSGLALGQQLQLPPPPPNFEWPWEIVTVPAGLKAVTLGVGANGLNTVQWQSPFDDTHIKIEWYDVWDPDHYWSGNEELYTEDVERMQKVTRSRMSPIIGSPVAQDVRGFLFARSTTESFLCYQPHSANDDIHVSRYKPRVTSAFDPMLGLPTTSVDSETGKDVNPTYSRENWCEERTHA
jgi:hypothetical protein